MTEEDMSLYEEEAPTYTVTVQVLTEYTVERIGASTEAEAVTQALDAIANDYGWTTKEDLETNVVAVEEEF